MNVASGLGGLWRGRVGEVGAAGYRAEALEFVSTQLQNVVFTI